MKNIKVNDWDLKLIRIYDHGLEKIYRKEAFKLSRDVLSSEEDIMLMDARNEIKSLGWEVLDLRIVDKYSVLIEAYVRKPNYKGVV